MIHLFEASWELTFAMLLLTDTALLFVQYPKHSVSGHSAQVNPSSEFITGHPRPL